MKSMVRFQRQPITKHPSLLQTSAPPPQNSSYPMADWLHRLSGCIIWAQRSRISRSSWFLAMATTSSRPSRSYFPTEKKTPGKCQQTNPPQYKYSLRPYFLKKGVWEYEGIMWWLCHHGHSHQAGLYCLGGFLALEGGEGSGPLRFS